MAERKRILREFCENVTIGLYNFNFSQVKEKYYKDGKAGMSYCKVPKAGSSLWTQIFMTFRAYMYHKQVENKTKTIQKIFHKSRSRLHVSSPFLSSNAPSKNDTYLNIVMARDPYSRLFSAYVDKIFLLNKLRYPRQISENNGKSPVSCGYNVTFQEFVDYVISRAENGSKINRHWSPIYLLCRPCDVRYDVVAKIESFTKDMKYILNHSDVSDYVKDVLLDILQDKTNIDGLLDTYMRQWKTHKEKCPSIKDYLIKLWKALQFQGEISFDLSFPTAEFPSLQKTTPNIMNVTKDLQQCVTKNRLTREKRRIQRREVLVNAYSTIRNSTITQIQGLFKLDFLLFRYDLSPP